MNLFWDESKLNSYFENFLIPIATEFKSHPALLAWDIINEPEGLLFVGKTDPEPCFDTRSLIGAGAGWDHDFVPMENILRFINHHAAVIKSIEGNTALVTAASYREFSNINAYGYKYGTKICQCYSTTNMLNIPRYSITRIELLQ